MGNILAVLYFIFVMWWIILFMAVAPLGILSDIKVVMTSGFATSDYAYSIIGVLGFFIGLSLLIPPFRKMYYKLPWLFPFVKIFFLNIVILGIAITILNYGYEVRSSARHTVFFILMVLQLVICRLAMCIYFHKKPVKYIEGGSEK